MHGHGAVGVIARGQFLYSSQALQIENYSLGGSQDHNLSLLWVETHHLEDAAPLYEVSLCGCLAQPMNGNYLILLHVIGRYRNQIVAFCLLELNMGGIALQFKSDAKSFPKVLCVLLIKMPIGAIASGSCSPRLVDHFITFSFESGRIFPDEYLDYFCVGKGDEIERGPVNAENGLFVLFLEQRFTGVSLPDYNQARFIPTSDVASIRTGRNGSDGTLVAMIGYIKGGWERSQGGGVRQFRDEGIRIDIQLLFLYPGTEVEIQTSLKPFLDEFVVNGHMPNLVKSSGDEIIGPVLLIHLLPLLQFFFCQQILLRWVVGLVMPWQFLLHRCYVDHFPLSCITTGPCVEQFVVFLLFSLIRVPFNSAGKQSVENLVDLHLLPLGGHEVAFGGRMRMDGKGVIVVILDLVAIGSHSLAGSLATAYAVNEVELFVRQTDISKIELIPDGAPPVLVL